MDKEIQERWNNTEKTNQTTEEQIMENTFYLKRIAQTNTSTIGDLTFDGVHICNILEDGFNFPKIAKETRIPAGKYRLVLREEGTHHQKYSKMFSFHVGMIQLEDVKDFKYILIHIGNTVKDTEGCLLTGSTFKFNPTTSNYELKKSTVAYIKAYKKIIEVMNSGETFINIS